MKKRLRDLLFEVEEKTTTTIKEETNTPSAVINQVEPDQISSSSPDITSSMLTKIQEAILKNEISGPDYLKLISTAKALEPFIPDEISRTKAAMEQLKQRFNNKEITFNVIIETCNDYLKMLKEEEERGKQEIQNTIESIISPKMLQLQEINTQVEEITGKIKELEKQKEKLLQSSKPIEDEIIDEQNKIQKQENAFKSAVETISTIIKTDIEKFKNIK